MSNPVMCYDCAIHAGTETFCEGVMDWVHGFSVQLCRCCVVKRQCDHMLKCIQAVNEALVLIIKEPCR